MGDLVGHILAELAASYRSAPITPELTDVFVTVVRATLDDLVQKGRIPGYTIDAQSLNTEATAAAGLFVVRVTSGEDRYDINIGEPQL